MKLPCDGPAGDLLGFNKYGISPSCLLKHDVVSPAIAGQSRLIVATVSRHGTASKRAKVGIAVAKPVASKRAKSLRVDALLENGCEQSVQSEQSPLTDLCSFARRRILASNGPG